jgi:chitinase
MRSVRGLEMSCRSRLNAYGGHAASVDIPPTVDIVSPTGLTMTATRALTVMATADDADGSVKSVTFFANDVAIGLNDASLQCRRSPIAGDYTLTAVALDNAGATTTSAARFM